MKTIFVSVLLMSVTGSSLMLCLSFLRPLTKKSFTATWHYRMYMLVVIALLVPIGIAGGNLFVNLQDMTGQEVSSVPNVPLILNDMLTAPSDAILPQNGMVLPQETALSQNPVTPKPVFHPKDILQYLPFGWIAGVFVFALWQSVQLVRFKRKITRTSLPVEDMENQAELHNAMANIGIKGKLGLFSNNIIKTPMLTGLFKTRLILPEVEMSGKELAVILKHELTHFKRRDLLVKSLALAANAIHWFNPVVYRLVKNIDTYCELSCDEIVVADMSMEERRFYGETILNVLSRLAYQQSGVFATLVESKKGIERRLTHMMNVKKNSKWIVMISLAAACLLWLSACATASIINMSRESQNDPTSIGADDGDNPLSGTDDNEQVLAEPDDLIPEQSNHSDDILPETMTKDVVVEGMTETTTLTRFDFGGVLSLYLDAEYFEYTPPSSEANCGGVIVKKEFQLYEDAPLPEIRVSFIENDNVSDWIGRVQEKANVDSNVEISQGVIGGYPCSIILDVMNGFSFITYGIDGTDGRFQISLRYSNEYTEGWGARVRQHLDTIVFYGISPD